MKEVSKVTCSSWHVPSQLDEGLSLRSPGCRASNPADCREFAPLNSRSCEFGGATNISFSTFPNTAVEKRTGKRNRAGNILNELSGCSKGIGFTRR